VLETITSFFYFNTVKLVTIHSVKLGVFHRTVQILAIFYILFYAIWFKMGYQEYSKVSGIIYMKAKGIGYINDSVNGLEIYDTNDLVEPPTESSAMFVTTGFIRTYQQRGICNSLIRCNTSADCTSALTPSGQVLEDCNTTAGFCRLLGWCPLESDSIKNINVLSAVENITVFLRSSVNYETFGKYIADPPEPIPGVNLFTLQQVIGNRNITECAQLGCIVSAQIDWTCNLNKESCSPRIYFIQVTGGFNFRTVNYDVDRTARDLDKLYGIRILMQITGIGGRFSFFQMVITIGAGAAFIALATVITDLILLFVFSSEVHFSEKKWSHIKLQEEKENTSL
jgi:hypothetical protein